MCWKYLMIWKKKLKILITNKNSSYIKNVILLFELFISRRQPGFTYSACGPFTENKESIQK